MIKRYLLTLGRAALLVLCSMPAISVPAHAGVFLTLEVQESYDDNVIGLTADNRASTTSPVSGGMASLTASSSKGGLDGIPGPGAGGGGTGGMGTGPTGTVTTVEKKGDFSTNLYASVGYDWDLGNGTRPFVLGSADHVRFNTYSQFDFTITDVSAGLSPRFSESFSVTVLATGSLKNYENDLRDGTAYGGKITFRERMSPSFWAKQFYRIEQNEADAAYYSYFGQSAGITAGYDVTQRSWLSIGYTYYLRDYRDSAPAVTVTSQIASLDWATELTASWSISLAYDHEWADSDIPDTASTNNRYSAGIRYDY